MVTEYSRSLSDILNVVTKHDKEHDLSVTASDCGVKIGLKNMDKWSYKLMCSVLYDLEDMGFNAKYESTSAMVSL